MRLSCRISKSSVKGFSLVEMVVVSGIIALLATTLITTFSRTRLNLNESTNLIAATIREAQSNTVASATYNNYNPCGYGVHYISAQKIAIYVGPSAATNDCVNINKNYTAGRDSIFSTKTFTDSRIEIKSAFNDIFFLPPDPKTYLNNVYALNQSPITIQIGVVGTACPTNCQTVYVYPSGKVQTQ